MKILVCFKILPNPDRVLTEDWDQFSLHTDLGYAGMDFNCFDRSALELGLQVKEQAAAQGVEASCAALTVSDSMPETLFSELYAVGYDRVLCIPDREREFSPRRIAGLLAETAEREQADLIITGTEAGWAQSGMVPYFLAERLNMPILSNAEGLTFEDGKLAVQSREPEGLVERRLSLPAVCTVGNSPAVLRFANLRARMACRSKKAELLPESSGIRQAEPVLTRPRIGRSCTVLPEEDVSSADRILALLREAAPGEEQTENIPAWLEGRSEDLILLPDSEAGRRAAVKLAAERELPCFFGGEITFCDDRSVTVKKLACAGNLEWTEELPLPAVVTVPVCLWNRLPDRREPLEEKPPLWEKKLLEAGGQDSLSGARLAVICGCGMKNRENADKARALAEKLGAGFGLTRPAALNAWGSTTEIVGQSGHVIAPACALVLGAAGAGAFAAGIDKARCIIAVNTDREALIFDRSDYGLCMDAGTLVDELLKKLN